MNVPLTTPRTVVCYDCGASFETLSRQLYRCPECRKAAARAAYERERAAKVRRRRETGMTPECRYSTCHFVRFLPGYPKDDGDLNLLGRYLAYHEVKKSPTGFLPDGLLLEVRNGGRLTMTGVVINGRAVFTKVDCTPPESVV